MSDAYDYFSTTEVSARLDLVRHLIENSELVPLVRGPSGIGKSLLASRIRQLAPENWSVCHFEADPTMQPERLLATIARCCGLPDIAGELLQRLVDRFEVLRKRGRIPVMLVDDAQMLPPTSLITLLRLFERQLDGVRLVSIVLFADEQIDLLLSTPQLQIMSPQAIQVIDMPVMTRQEATAYMFFLLKNEGLSEKLALDEVKLNRVYKETGGNPGLLASAILNAVGEDGGKKGTGSFLGGYKKQLLIGGIPLLLVIFLLLFLGPISSLFEPEIVSIPEKSFDKEIAPLPAPPAPPLPELPVIDTAENATTPPPKTAAAVEEPGEVDGALVGEEQLASVEEPVQSAQTAKPDDVVPDSVTEGETAPASPERPDAQGSGEQGEMEMAGVESAKAKIGEEAATAGARQTVDESTVALEVDQVLEQPSVADAGRAEELKTSSIEDESTTDAPGSKQEVEAQQSSPAGETAEAESMAATKKIARDEALTWVMSRSPKNYTLQLIAVENLDSLTGYIHKNRLHKETHTIEMTRNGKPWYALLWGDFPDRKSAMQAASTLPSTVQKEGVWARTFASLQQSKAR